MAVSAHEQILNGFGQTQAAFGLAVYHALCRESSRNKNSAAITATVQQLARTAGLGYRKTQDCLHALAGKGLISIVPGKRTTGHTVQPPNTYTLLSLHTRTAAAPSSMRPAECGASHPSPAETPIGKDIKNPDGLAPAGAAQSVASDWKGDKW